MICYHHNDLDGMSAAYVVHTYKPKQIEDSPYSYFACNYEDKFDKHTMKDDVIIVDISISEKTYPMLIETCKTARTVTWIDHHSTSKEVIEKHYEELQSIRNLTYIVSEVACGSMLAYLYFHIPASEFSKIRDINVEDNENYSVIISTGIKEENFNPDNTEVYTFTALKKHNANKNFKTTISDFMEHIIIVPKWLQLVNDHDCWRKKIKNTENFYFGTQTKNISFTIQDGENKVYNPFWLNKEIENPNLIEKGKDISNYIHNRYNEELKDTFEYTIDGTTFLCKNGLGNSYNFEHLIDRYEAVILFNYSGSIGKWEYSVYSGDRSTFNCTEFCKKYGGGGHFHASGFSTDKLIFLHPSNRLSKENIIFLGGTVNDDWRSKFIDLWKKAEKEDTNLKNRGIELFNPVVEDWTQECIDKEGNIKNKSIMNLFLITPEQTDPYSFVEALDCAIDGSNVYLAIYDEYKKFSAKDYKSFDSIGKIIEKHGGIYEKYVGEDMEILIKDIITSL